MDIPALCFLGRDTPNNMRRLYKRVFKKAIIEFRVQ